MKLMIIGAGRIGIYLGKMLVADDHDVTVIDADPAQVRYATDHLDAMVLEGNGASPELLLTAGLKNMEMLIAVTGNDEINIMACMIAAKAGVAIKVARLRNLEYSAPDCVLQKEYLGIDYIIHPEVETARELVWLIRRASATDVIELEGGKIQLIGLRIDAQAPSLNQNLHSISQVHPGLLFRVVAINRNNRTIIPTGEDYIRKGDQIFFIAESANVAKILSVFGKADEKLENLMILGGGRVGRMVAEELEKDKDLNIKLIESNREKSVKIADQLKRTLLILGDGTDLDLLAAEGIMDMDGFLAVTADEENNIISCLMAKHLGVRRTFALINRSDYLPLMQSIGLDAAVDLQMITANTILRFIRRGNIVSVASFPGIDAELLEVKVTDRAKVLNKPIKHITLPKDCIIGLISREQEIIVPVGDSILRSGDKLMIFALPTAIQGIAKALQ